MRVAGGPAFRLILDDEQRCNETDKPDEVHAARSQDCIAAMVDRGDFDRKPVSDVGSGAETIMGRQST
jgi:hypothetical protein